MSSGLESFAFTEHLVMHPRPLTKRARHTWPTPTIKRSHFEDFMLEIGADPRVAHLCCVPRPEIMSAYHAAKYKNAETIAINPKKEKAPLRQYTLELHPHPHPHYRSSQTPTTPKPAAPCLLHTLAHATIKDPLKSSGHALQLKSPASSNLDRESFPSSRPSLPPAAARDKLHEIAGQQNIDRRPSQSLASLTSSHRESWTIESSSRRQPSSVPSQSTSSSRSSSLDAVRSRAPSFTSLATASSSEGPTTPRATTPSLPPTHDVNVTLSDVEQTSRFRTPACCTTCRRSGSNFPRCPKCGDAWCSRQCRTIAHKGGRHSCNLNVSDIFNRDE